MQGIDDIEILVVDDASTDGTGAWLAAEALRDPRVVPLHTERKGPAYTRNLAINQARAPLVAFLDADDLWWPRKLERALAFHEARPEIGFSFTDYLAVGPQGDVRGTCFGFWRPGYVSRRTTEFTIVPEAELELLAANVVGTSTVVASRRALQNANGFAISSLSAEDWDLWLRLAGKDPVACSAASTTTYLMRPTSVTQNRSARIEAMRASSNLTGAEPKSGRDRPGGRPRRGSTWRKPSGPALSAIIGAPRAPISTRSSIGRSGERRAPPPPTCVAACKGTG